MKKANIEEFFARLAAQNPAPTTELEYTDPYTLLVSVVLSAQATDVGVNKATKGLFAVADTPQGMSVKDLRKLIVEAGRIPVRRDTLYNEVTEPAVAVTV